MFSVFIQFFFQKPLLNNMIKPTFNLKIRCPVAIQCCIWPNRANGMSPTQSVDTDSCGNNKTENKKPQKNHTETIEIEELETEL